VILTFVEHEDGRLTDLSLEALTFARRLGERVGAPVEAVTVGASARALAGSLSGFGVTAIHVAVDERLDAYAPRAWARALVSVLDDRAPDALVSTASDRGAEVMAHVASLTDAPLAANCTHAEPEAGPGDREAWAVTRQRWGGSLLEEARVRGSMLLCTVAPHALAAEGGDARGSPEVLEIVPPLEDGDLAVRVTDRVSAGTGAVSLSEAKVVVGGGRGVGGAEGFGALEELAGLLGGAVGCSRVVTSNGWRPHTDQIGQTGTRIAPDVYIACGISGATQHIVGCRAAKSIIVINTDAEAPILSQADYAVIGDLREIVPAISAELRKTGAAAAPVA
jgi:electron transfer flavoprotein alpha subunit